MAGQEPRGTGTRSGSVAECSFGQMSETEVGEFWFCIRHQRVEGHDGCANRYRLGPYPTREAAARAVETAHEKSEAWDDDPRWNDHDELED